MMGTAPLIGIVCGLESERQALGPQILDDPAVVVTASGARPHAAEAAARAMAADGVRLLVSWGLAGGLDARHDTGDIVLPKAVVGEDGGRWEAAPLPLPPSTPNGERIAQTPRLVGLESIVFNPQEKRSLAVASGASLADMESHRVARAAEAHGIPLVVVRAVGDASGRALPRLAATAIGPDGHPHIGSVLLGLLRWPSDLPALIHAARDSARAHASLSACAPVLAPALRRLAEDGG
ncbi:MAG: hypothetical protein AAFR84_05765 [Pseudomonadota bacterium]